MQKNTPSIHQPPPSLLQPPTKLKTNGFSLQHLKHFMVILLVFLHTILTILSQWDLKIIIQILYAATK